jgi:hypothetical protein
MGDLQGPEKMNDTCGKMMHMGTIDRGVTVLSSGVNKLEVHNFPCYD